MAAWQTGPYADCQNALARTALSVDLFPANVSASRAGCDVLGVPAMAP